MLSTSLVLSESAKPNQTNTHPNNQLKPVLMQERVFALFLLTSKKLTAQSL